MNKPIYRHLAEKKWRSYERKLVVQRITQMNIVPDILMALNPTVATRLTFNGEKVRHGDFVSSAVSEAPPALTIQPYSRDEKLVTIAFISPDVPNVEKDAFDYRCHFLASNIPISLAETYVELGALDTTTQVIIPWLPPYSQKGAPYQRIAVFVLEQFSPTGSAAQRLDLAAVRQAGRYDTRRKEFNPYTKREDFILRSLIDRYHLRPIGVDLFRTVWDDGTAGVMERAGIVGADVEFKRKRIEPLPYQRLKGERYR